MNTALNNSKNLLNTLYEFFVKQKYGVDKFLVFRITLGIFMLYKALSLSPYWLDFFGDKGFFSREIIEVNNHSVTFSYFKICDFISGMTGLHTEAVYSAIQLVFITSAIFFMIGFVTRISALVLLLINVTLTSSFVEYSYGVDYFLSSLLFYSLFFPLGLSHSVDREWTKRWTEKFRNFTFDIGEKRASLILGIHLCVVYVIGGLTKAGGPTWWNGEAIWKAINRPDNDLAIYFAEYLDFKYIYIALGVSTMLVELLYPVMIWFQRSRALWLPMILMMHLFIGIVLELYFFAAVMMFFNTMAFGNFQKNEETAHCTPSKKSLPLVTGTVPALSGQ